MTTALPMNWATELVGAAAVEQARRPAADVSAPVGPGTPNWPVANNPRLSVPQMPQKPWTGHGTDRVVDPEPLDEVDAEAPRRRRRRAPMMIAPSGFTQ